MRPVKSNKRPYVIYETSGPAKEYNELAVNLYIGCSHACEYCYAPGVMHKRRNEFFEQPAVRQFVLDKLYTDLYKMWLNEDDREVMMCFACDPYQPIDTKYQATREAIKMFMKFERHFTILTKGGRRSVRDFDLLNQRKDLCRYGATLVFASDADSLKYEPGAAKTSERIEALKFAHELKIKNWVSLEPAWGIEDVKALIDMTAGVVDEYKIGPLNYHKHKKDVDWHKFKSEIADFCEWQGVNYSFKKALEVLQ